MTDNLDEGVVGGLVFNSRRDEQWWKRQKNPGGNPAPEKVNESSGVDSLVNVLVDDIPRTVGVRKEKVTPDKIRKLLSDLKIGDALEFGKFFKNKDPIIKFARIYRDVFIFGAPVDKAVHLNENLEENSTIDSLVQDAYKAAEASGMMSDMDSNDKNRVLSKIKTSVIVKTRAGKKTAQINLKNSGVDFDKTVEINEDAATNFAGGDPNPNVAGLDEPFRAEKPKKRDTFAGDVVFEVDEETFSKSIQGKPKWARYKNFVSLEDFPNVGQEIKEYAYRNPSKSIILKEKRTGRMIYLKGFKQ